MYKLREKQLNDKAILPRKDINEPPRGNHTDGGYRMWLEVDLLGGGEE